jgi:hypothetical protein
MKLAVVNAFLCSLAMAPENSIDDTKQVFQFELPVQSVVARLNFPHERTRGLYQTLGGTVAKALVVCGDPAYHCMCSMQVIDITPMKHHLTSITSIRMVQQKYRRSTVCL